MSLELESEIPHDVKELVGLISEFGSKGLDGVEIAEKLEENHNDIKKVGTAMLLSGYLAFIQSFSEESQALQVSDKKLKPEMPWQMQAFYEMIEIKTVVWNWRPDNIIEGEFEVKE